MNAFVVTTPAPEQVEAKIASAAFWPEVDPAKIRAAQRINNTITPERLRETLIEAIASVNGELASWRAARELEGRAKLADIPAEQIDSVSIHVNRYLRAVGCMAKAALQERYSDYDTTASGNKKADQLEDPIDDLRRDARWAISDIHGVTRTTVELI
ncbi:MAG: head completion/stabilization protein [Nitrosomonadales bacterium]|nr:head completion/stabilization protein [Nitrosomonadales bacterium]